MRLFSSQQSRSTDAATQVALFLCGAWRIPPHVLGLGSFSTRRAHMRYQLKQIYCRPWLLDGLSLKLMESHYENNYGGALRRLNAITEQLESLDFATAPVHVVNG